MPDMSDAPRPITLSDGSKWKMHPLRDVDLDELSNWVQACTIATAAMAGRFGELSQEERDAIIRVALQAASGMRWNDSIGRKLILQPRGVVQILLLSCRAGGDETKLLKLVREPENLQLIFAVFRDLNLTPAEPEAHPTEPAATPEENLSPK